MLKRVPILTGGFGAQGSSASPAARAPRSACAPASGFQGSRGARTQHSNCSPAGRPLCPSLLCTEPVRRPPPFHTQPRKAARPRCPCSNLGCACFAAKSGRLASSLSPHPRRETNSTRLVEGRVFSREVFAQCLARGKHSANVSCCYLKSRKLRSRG